MIVRQSPTQMIRNMADERDIHWEKLVDRTGAEPPWSKETVTQLFHWMKPMRKYSDAENDARRMHRNSQRDGRLDHISRVVVSLRVRDE